ncbi:DUF1385 domain-containing protein [archaeon]|jgi:uncharacterized protein YqhQ|nr:DUF1385 domain-containing protein [archaeon]MBT4023144.1 DUF1385 domain-containing protein [archaeon]MBT4271853.1 DUF1385 domain-containing protein [archaeon]MBT4460741.1 DUF1385 domain-containing protein [archaeon]MBT4858335.1 DUF1385 domain-containing protein [archaeon]
MGNEITIGGQAVMEGVMMRSLDKYAIAVRQPDKKIKIKKIKIKKNKNKIANLPIIRGCVRFIETMNIGIKALSFSASVSQGDEEESLSTLELIFTITLSIAMTILLFYIAPLFLTRFITDKVGILFNIIDGVFRLLIFFAYLLLISLMPDIRRIFQYHGAEHMTVFAYENKEKLTVKNVKKYTTLHPRCGTSFLLLVFVLSVFFFTLIKVEGYFPRLGLRLLLLPLIAGVSYEILKFAGKHTDNIFVKILIAPGLLLQKITTRRPTDDMLEVAIKSLKAALS